MQPGMPGQIHIAYGREQVMSRYLWIPLTIMLLLPVPVILLAHLPRAGSYVNGELFTGISSLDSIIAASSGRPVLINFWATWCGPCVRELPELEALAGSPDNMAVVLAVDIGDPEFATLTAFRENNPLGLTVIWLSTEDAAFVSERYSLPDLLPVTIVLDGDGREVQRAAGARNGEWFAAAVSGVHCGQVAVPGETCEIHIYVVGPAGDPLVDELARAASDIAGETGYDVLDPGVPADSVLMEEAYLPMNGWPYAQLCMGGACSPPVANVSELYAAYEGMR